MDQVQRVSKSRKSNLKFPVSRIKAMLLVNNYAHQISDKSAVFLAAVIEYVCMEILEWSLNAARSHSNSNRIQPEHINIALRRDPELSAMFPRLVIPRSTLVSMVHYPRMITGFPQTRGSESSTNRTTHPSVNRTAGPLAKITAGTLLKSSDETSGKRTDVKSKKSTAGTSVKSADEPSSGKRIAVKSKKNTAGTSVKSSDETSSGKRTAVTSKNNTAGPSGKFTVGPSGNSQAVISARDC
ncbi:hypothetical protein JTE90_008700 [Oedothorax gibbosus]|uniref:Histone H2A n=1 Tax=Oedothorax gibbosus TaxID=931172 RepID=A0AAV6V0C4_9ARAC|nr:hypothetical protein JTE90_008700 [Oedothorax gibbosus]